MSDVVIIGAGVAGTSAAALLAMGGRSVTILEQEAAPVDKICGEFISVEAQCYIARLGVDMRALRAEPITTMALTVGTKTIMHRLPFAGLSLSRRVLDEALLQAALKAGATLERSTRVRCLDTTSPLRVISDAKDYPASAVLLATGKHDLRGQKRARTVPIEPLLGFKTYFQLTAARQEVLSGRVELFIFDGGYAGLQPVERGRANLCLLVNERRFSALGRDWPRLLDALAKDTPRLEALLANAQPTLAKPLSIYRVPFGFVHRVGDRDHPAIYRLGDQVAVTHSFTGDGMALALQSGVVAAQTILRGESAATYHRIITKDIGRQVCRSRLLYRILRGKSARRSLMVAAHWCPSLLSLGVSWTRLPAAAIARAMAASGWPARPLER